MTTPKLPKVYQTIAKEVPDDVTEYYDRTFKQWKPFTKTSAFPGSYPVWKAGCDERTNSSAQRYLYLKLWSDGDIGWAYSNYRLKMR